MFVGLKGSLVNSVHIDKSEDLQGRIAKSKMWWFENLSSSSTVVEVLINGYKLPFIGEYHSSHSYCT